MNIRTAFRAIPMWLLLAPLALRAEVAVRHLCVIEQVEMTVASDLSSLSPRLSTACKVVMPEGPLMAHSEPSGDAWWPLAIVQARGPAGRSSRQLAVTPQLDQLISHAADAVGISAPLIKAVIAVESQFNAKAISSKGAMGLMQLMPTTAKEVGVMDASTLLDPAVNILAGAQVLALLLARFHGQTDLALAAYNAGPQAVIKHDWKVPPYKETQAYVVRVKQEWAQFEAQPTIRRQLF